MQIALLKSNHNRFHVGNPNPDKYAGRMVADVFDGDVSVVDYMIREGHAKPYDGGTKPAWDF